MWMRLTLCSHLFWVFCGQWHGYLFGCQLDDDDSTSWAHCWTRSRMNSSLSQMTRTLMPITVFLDNARYQKCALVTATAISLGIELCFSPSYSPNLNLIERLWKFVKKQCLYSKYYSEFSSFNQAITDCLGQTHSQHKVALDSFFRFVVDLEISDVWKSAVCDRVKYRRGVGWRYRRTWPMCDDLMGGSNYFCSSAPHNTRPSMKISESENAWGTLLFNMIEVW